MFAPTGLVPVERKFRWVGNRSPLSSGTRSLYEASRMSLADAAIQLLHHRREAGGVDSLEARWVNNVRVFPNEFRG